MIVGIDRRPRVRLIVFEFVNGRIAAFDPGDQPGWFAGTEKQHAGGCEQFVTCPQAGKLVDVARVGDGRAVDLRIL